MIEKFTDKDLGEIQIRRNARAKNVTARAKNGYIQFTIPALLTQNQFDLILEQMRPRLVSLSIKPSIKFTPDTKFETYSFSLKIELAPVQNYYMNLKNGQLMIVCPENTQFNDQLVQNRVKNLVEKALRFEAKRLFPDKLALLAKQYKFNYKDLKINKSKTRWGSCTSLGNINLSHYCLLLPEYLIDFVMLHELCHTVEMNHGVKFWRLLDSITDNKSKILTSELKSYIINW